MIVKEIKTNRLYLRPFKDTDGADLYDYLSDSYIKKTLNFNGCSLDECEAIVNSRAKGDSFFAVVLNEQMIGHIELHETKHPGVHEIGYVFNPKIYGNGYAYEALEAVLHHAKLIHINHLVASTSPNNKPSIRLLERLGFIPYEGMNLSDYADPDDLQFNLLTSE
jgi:[ribosomal protein S5]-alanine N-acetyltransferase